MAGAPRATSRFGFCSFISNTRTIARGVTAMVVGSGALLGLVPSSLELEVIIVRNTPHDPNLIVQIPIHRFPHISG